MSLLCLIASSTFTLKKADWKSIQRILSLYVFCVLFFSSELDGTMYWAYVPPQACLTPITLLYNMCSVLNLLYNIL